MIVIPLGVASATPTAVRHLPAVALWREGSVFLFDCGENAQMRMLQAGLKRSKIECIFISHFDVDHYSGLMGLISTLQLQRRDKELTIVGPKGVKEFVEWNLNFSGVELGFEINFSEVEEGQEEAIVVDAEDYYVEARPLKHKRFCLGYRFQEKDKPGKVDADKAAALGITNDEQFKELKAGNTVTTEDGRTVEAYEIVGHPRPGDSFAYVSDTEYCPNSVKLAMNTNILYHEATFSVQLADKARETGHSTAADAARVANEAQSKLLVIGHFSARYTNLHVLLKEARDAFYPTWLANELRPIFTDPTHERGIVEPKVELRDLTKKPDRPMGGGRPSYNKGGGRGGDRDHRGGGGSKNFRSRKPRQRSDNDRGGGYRSNDRGGYRGGGSRDGYNNDRGGYRGGSNRDGYSNDRGGYRGGSNRDGYSNDRSGGNRYNNDRGGNDRRYGSNQYGSNQYGSNQYGNRNRNDEDKESQPKRTITPRTSYDDFDRF